MTWVSVLTTIFNGTLYPLAFLAGWGYGLLRVLAWPLLYLGHALLHLTLFPLRLLAKFEVRIYGLLAPQQKDEAYRSLS